MAAETGPQKNNRKQSLHTCPVCAQRPGEPCVSGPGSEITGIPLDTFHDERKELDKEDPNSVHLRDDERPSVQIVESPADGK